MTQIPLPGVDLTKHSQSATIEGREGRGPLGSRPSAGSDGPNPLPNLTSCPICGTMFREWIKNVHIMRAKKLQALRHGRHIHNDDTANPHTEKA